MASLHFTKFSGVAPYTPPRYLAEEQAQTAQNVAAWVGPLRPIKDTSKVMDFVKTGDITSIYRFGKSLDSSTQYWFHWTEDVDVVEGFIHGDTSERTFYTGTGAPMVTDSTLALGGTGAYPTASYLLGVLAPTTAPTCAVTGTPDDGAFTEDRVYTYTFVNSWGEESAPYAADPMPSSAQVTVQTGETVDVTTAVPASGNYNITNKRIYRATAGVYLFVAEIPAATTLYNDAISADDLGEEIPSLTWDAPPATMTGIIGLPGGVIAGFVGNSVYFCDPYHPFAYPTDYMQTVKYDVIGLAAIDTTTVVLTKGKPYFIQGSHPDSQVVVEADVSQACVSKRSILAINGIVYYASPDGLVAISPASSTVITQRTFTKAQWQAYEPSSIHAHVHEGRYVGFYDTGTVQGGFIFDPDKNVFIDMTVGAAGGYNDLKNDALYVIVDNELHLWEGGANLTYTWKSKQFTMPVAEPFSCFRIEAEAYPVTIKVYGDGSLLHTQAVADNSIYRLPAGRHKLWEVQLSGTGEVFSVWVAQSPKEIASG